MALLFMDGFDHYATADISKKWASSAGGASINTTGGRRGTGCLRYGIGGSAVSRPFTASAAVIVGLAFKIGTIYAGYRTVFVLREGTTEHISLIINNNGTISIYRGSQSGTLLGTSTTAISQTNYNYVELKATINDTTGAINVQINGVNESALALTGIDTRNGGTSGVVDSICVGQSSNGTDSYIDDLYVCNSSGATNNNFLGDCRVDTILPSGDGNYTQFTPSTGTAHYALVDENPPNTTDYNSSATSGNRDSYTFPDLAGLSSQTIYGVQINAAALKDDAGARSLGTMSRLSSTDKDGAGAALSTALVFISEIQETDPASAAWTESNVNAAEFGVKVTA